MDNMIIVDDVSVRISENFILGPVSFKIPKESVVGIIGANGSGKSILISTLVGLIKPTTGFVKIHTNHYSVALQTPSYYPNKTLLQNLQLFSKLRNVSRIEIEQLLEDFNITIYKNKIFKQLSEGTQKRMEIISALAGKPDLVFLDEPTANIDENGIKILRNKLLQFKESGKTLLITNHQSFELEEICTHYLVVKNGLIVEFLSNDVFLGKHKSVENAIRHIFKSK